MNRTNLPILYQNIMFGLPNDLAREAFLWAVERPGEDRMCYRAERFARQVAHIVDTLSPMLAAAARIHGLRTYDPDLLQFALKRHSNWVFGGNVTPSYNATTP